MMLHVGCGDSRIEEFVNIDCRATKTTDLVADAWDLGAIASNSVEYIYSRHMLEHLSIHDAAKSLREWRRVLMPGGIVHVVVPNLIFHARQLLGLIERPGFPDQQAHALAGFYGWQNEANGGTKEDMHRWGYTPASLERLLVSCGLRPTTDGIDQLIELDPEPWHINVRATKEG